MPIHLKSNIRPRPGDFRSTALLIAPDLQGVVGNDQELYAAIRKVGKATIRKFQDDNPFELEPPVTLEAEVFIEQWRGG